MMTTLVTQKKIPLEISQLIGSRSVSYALYKSNLLTLKCEVIEKKNFTGCERRVISKIFVSKCCVLRVQSLSGNMEGSTHSV